MLEFFSSPRRLRVPYACNGLISQSSVQPHERSVTPPTNQPLSSCRKKSSTKTRCSCAMHNARNVYFRAQTRHCKGSLHGAGYPDGTSAPAGTTISVGSCRIERQRCLFVPPTLKSDGGPSSTSSNGSSANAEECVTSSKYLCAWSLNFRKVCACLNGVLPRFLPETILHTQSQCSS